MRRARLAIAAAAFVAASVPVLSHGQPARIALDRGWMLQSSARDTTGGAVISRVGHDVTGWHRITVPNTVVGALVQNGHLPDPYFGMNLRSLPGTTYPIGERFALLPTPDDSPYKPSWWYRIEFVLAASSASKHLALHFNGINYRANIWINGQQVATSEEVVGPFRRYEFDITTVVKTGATNALAVEVFTPGPEDLGIMWVDWNPTPPDKNMGLWGDVYLTESGPLALRHPYVRSELDVPSLETAKLTVIADVVNRTDRPVTGDVRGTIGDIKFSGRVSLKGRERQTLRFTPADVPALTFRNPRVWWPYRHGDQPLYTLTLDADVGGVRSDRQEVTFGIQQMSTELTPAGHRLFKVNGRPILIRGGGWASDMLLRPASRERLEAEFRYVKEMGLNTIRLEGKLESDEFYDLADRHGILLMPGWCCCDQWEKWDKWDAEDHRVAPASLQSQALRLRNHPSVIAWLNGSDFPPPAKVEQAYLDVLRQCEWSKPIVSNATEAPGPVSGPSGMKMKGPYDYVPPSYWLADTANGGAFGFATEIGPGAAVPPVESLMRMLPRDRLWPIDEFWRFHAGGDEFKDLTLFTAALEGRYGKATDVRDYARKAQALTYEGQRAMFEAYGRNKYTSTGVIQWMLNNAWPSMIWHLYDYYLRPGGGYFGTRKAMEPLHVQYSYDDRSVVVVNDRYEHSSGLTVSAEVFDLGLTQKFSRTTTVDVAPDATARALVIPPLDDLGTTYFVRLRLADSSGRELSRNFYWLSTEDDVLDWKNTKWYYTPTARHANLRALATLPPTSLALSSRAGTDGADDASVVTITNTGTALAFQVRLKLLNTETGEEILPVFWEDNYFELFPGESRDIRVAVPRGSGRTRVEAEAWNVGT